ncbi:hypothetical protein Tco_0360256 [Tanacetum coccineum]
MREMASIKEAHYKQKLEGYYNKNVKPSTFNPGTHVLRLNSASKAKYQGKIGPTWEGPYMIRKAYRDGAYKLETLSGEAIDRTWNGTNLQTLLEDMDQDSAHMVATSKIPIIKPGEFEWMGIEQYIQMIDDALNKKAQRRLEVKARSTLMMGIPNEHQLKFNSIKDAKLLLEAVEKRFGGNAATKKTQRNLLKQQYENFTAPSSEMLDQTFDRLQKLVSQLELLDEKLSQEDVNQKLLRSLSPEWNTHAIVWRNKAELETMSMDDLYNNFKWYEPRSQRDVYLSLSTQNMAFVSFSNNNTSSSNEVVNAAYEVTIASTQVNATNSTNIDYLSYDVICSFIASQPYSPQLAHEDLQQIHPDDIEEMDLRWQMAMLTMRARRFLKNTGRKLTVNGNETIGFDKSKWMSYKWPHEGYNFASVKNDDAPIIKEWVSDDEEENMSETKIEKKIVKPSIARIEFIKPKQQEKTTRKNVKQGNPQMDLQDQGVIDSGCSRHMKGNMSYLTDYKEIDGEYVAFGGNPKGGKIIKKGESSTEYGKKECRD